ncbi:hypothetical protein [Rhodococcus wratislaviensis]|uniref:hypothetical protein n=1 Tax=Rhodococcus wratislaviensis TaxID=44752 RepID=UPI003668B042
MRRLPALALGASTAAVAVVIAAPPASADTPGDADSPSVLAATGSAASDVLGSCADELGAGRRRHRPRLVAALELGDVSESAGPGSFDHTPAADEASSESEPAEDIAPKPAEDEATGTGEAGTTTEEQSEPTDPAGVEAPSPRGAFTGSEHGHRRRDRRARGRGRRDAVGEVFDFTSNRTWRSRSPVRSARAASRCPT